MAPIRSDVASAAVTQVWDSEFKDILKNAGFTVTTDKTMDVDAVFTGTILTNGAKSEIQEVEWDAPEHVRRGFTSEADAVGAVKRDGKWYRKATYYFCEFQIKVILTSARDNIEILTSENIKQRKPLEYGEFKKKNLELERMREDSLVQMRRDVAEAILKAKGCDAAGGC